MQSVLLLLSSVLGLSGIFYFLQHYRQSGCVFVISHPSGLTLARSRCTPAELFTPVSFIFLYSCCMFSLSAAGLVQLFSATPFCSRTNKHQTHVYIFILIITRSAASQPDV